jgi:hypothetical protein
MGLKMGKVENWWVFPGFEIELMATGLNLPVNIAFVPNSGNNAKNPLLYVTELYGQVKAITNDWSIYTYTTNLLNYKSDYQIPGICFFFYINWIFLSNTTACFGLQVKNDYFAYLNLFYGKTILFK